MEIFIAFCLLIGAFTLGATTSHSEVDEHPDTVVAQAEQDPSHIPVGEDHRPCRYAAGPLLQRDLTLPRPLLEVSYDGIAEGQDTACRDH